MPSLFDDIDAIDRESKTTEPVLSRTLDVTNTRTDLSILTLINAREGGIHQGKIECMRDCAQKSANATRTWGRGFIHGFILGIAVTTLGALMFYIFRELGRVTR